MFDGSTEDLPSYIPGYDEWLEEREQETAYDKYIERLVDEQILERLEKEEKDEQKRKETI